jgi:hypothetical protein
MKKVIAILTLVGTGLGAHADWQQGVEVGFMEFRGVPVYQAAVVTESDSKFQWRLAYSRADHLDEGIERDWDSQGWAQLSFHQAWQLPLWKVHWFVGGSYTVDEEGRRAPGLGSKANFHLGLYRNFGNWRLSLRHDSNGDLATKECRDNRVPIKNVGLTPQEQPYTTVDICTGANNTGQNFLTLARMF